MLFGTLKVTYGTMLELGSVQSSSGAELLRMEAGGVALVAPAYVKMDTALATELLLQPEFGSTWNQ